MRAFMQKRIGSGRYGLTRGLKKRLWSFYNSFSESTGGEGKSNFLKGGIGLNDGGGIDEFADVLMTEDDQYVTVEDGVFLKAD
jgi:hypothetical protein